MTRKMPFALAMLLTLTVSSTALAQGKGEITGFAGYAFGGKIGLATGDLKVVDSEMYGAILGLFVRPGYAVELSWNYQPTELEWRPLVGERERIGLDVHYFQIGGLRQVDSGNAHPFLKFTLGATYYNPANDLLNDVNLSSEWRFSFTLGLGAKYFFNPRVALRLQGDLVGTFLNTSGGMFCGFGGCSLGLFGSGVISGDVTGGLSIAF
jgi:hypothetical protein